MMKKMIMLLLLCTLCVSGNAFALDLDQIQIHGFASQGYLRSNHYDYLGAETEKGTVEFNEFGLNVTSNLSDNLRFGIQMLARDLGDNGNDTLRVDWAFGDYRYRNWLGLRAGKMKKAFGLYNQSRDIDAARTGIFLPLGMYQEGRLRTAQQSVKGVALYGSVAGGFNYQVQYGTLDSDFEEFYRDSPGVLSTELADDNYILHLGWNTPLDGLNVVGSFNRESWSQIQEAGPENLELEFVRDAWVVGLEYLVGDVTCAVEYAQATFNIKMIGFPGRDFTKEFYHGLLSYRFTEWFEVGASYSVIYGDKDDKEGNSYAQQGQPRALAWRKDLAISTRFDLTDAWIVKLEGHWYNGLNGVSSYGENPSEDGFLGAAKVTFSF
jgi:hypothetical protein